MKASEFVSVLTNHPEMGLRTKDGGCITPQKHHSEVRSEPPFRMLSTSQIVIIFDGLKYDRSNVFLMNGDKLVGLIIRPHEWEIAEATA